MVRESENQILFLRNICFNITHTYQSLSLYFPQADHTTKKHKIVWWQKNSEIYSVKFIVDKVT